MPGSRSPRPSPALRFRVERDIDRGVVLVTAAGQAGSSGRPTALFVLGMARSGTAAITRVLSLAGVSLPAGMVGANKSNPLGFWEPRKAVYLNNAILRRHGSAGYDPSLRLQEGGVIDAKARADGIRKITAYLASMPDAPVVVIKELQITALSDMWFEAARLAGFDVEAVIALRHPEEVMASFSAMAGGAPTVHASPELAGAMWLKYTLLAERSTRELPRVFVEYANLLENWRREVKRISAALALDLNIRDESEIDGFLKPDLRHQRGGSISELFGADWISTVYGELGAAARDEPWDEAALDRVFEAYRASEQGFRTAIGDFQHNFRNVFMRPSITKLAGEIGAIAHRRKGSWA